MKEEIGIWSEIKLEIIKSYAFEYSKILSKRTYLYHIYIDAFAGSGEHKSKRLGEWIEGSPLNALDIDPPFKEYHLIDRDKKKFKRLKELVKGHKNVKNVSLYNEDSNKLLLEEILPKAKHEEFRRALCLLAPDGLHLNWNVVYKAGQMKSVEIFLNFPIMDMNMNVLWHDLEKVDPKQKERMNSFWGDESWKEISYIPSRQTDMFNPDPKDKVGNEEIVEAYRKRLKKVAGFKYVPKPIPMRNNKGATLYYLFFASPNKVANKIVEYIFNKHKDKGIK